MYAVLAAMYESTLYTQTGPAQTNTEYAIHRSCNVSQTDSYHTIYTIRHSWWKHRHTNQPHTCNHCHCIYTHLQMLLDQNTITQLNGKTSFAPLDSIVNTSYYAVTTYHYELSHADTALYRDGRISTDIVKIHRQPGKTQLTSFTTSHA